MGFRIETWDLLAVEADVAPAVDAEVVEQQTLGFRGCLGLRM